MRHAGSRVVRAVVGVLVAVALSLGARSSAAPQSTIALTPETLLLAVDRLLADRWYPQPRASASPITDDQQILRGALTSQVESVRRLAVRSLGRFENPLDVPTLVGYLSDNAASVRREAANALAQALHAATSSNSRELTIALQALQAPRRPPEPSPTVRDAIREAVGVLQLAAELPDQLPPNLLVQLIRKHPNTRLTAERRRQLRTLAWPAMGQPDVSALEILFRAGDFDRPLLDFAAHYMCTKFGEPDCGWQVRALAAETLDPLQGDAALLATLARDLSPYVRIAALRGLERGLAQTKDCGPFLDAASDLHEWTLVQVEALGLIDARCGEREEVARRLIGLAGALGGQPDNMHWHVPAKALEVLAKFDVKEAQRIMDAFAVASDVWQVRASAARTAATLRNNAALLQLAHDDNPNVRTAALGGLSAIKSGQLTDEAIGALDSDDYQLVRAAADALRATSQGDKAAPALLTALKRITGQGKDTSREVRLAILDRLGELARVQLGGASLLASYVPDDLGPFLKDYDPLVADAAADVIHTVTGSSPHAEPARRPPQQPAMFELDSLPAQALLTMSNNDQIRLDLLLDDAPFTVARFVKLAQQHYYDGLTFHRVVLRLIAQGGSPAANDDMSDARFLRDEIGFARHQRGAVGLVTHGRDTGNAQFFIDLDDEPAFDREYTVFARVLGTGPVGARNSVMPVRPGFDMAAVDALLDGSKIAKITFPPPSR